MCINVGTGIWLHVNMYVYYDVIGIVSMSGPKTCHCGRVILIQKFLFLQLLHGFKLFHFVHRFQNCFCFRSTTIPSAVRTFGQRLLVLHCNYNGAVAPKFDLVITFDWGVLLTQGQRVLTAFCKIFSGIPHLTIFGTPKCVPQILCLANLAVFGHVFLRPKYGQSGQFHNNIKLEMGIKMSFMGL